MRAAGNPFSVARLEALSFRGITPARLEELLVQHNSRGAIIGPHGSGKTTLLEDFARYIQNRNGSVSLFRLHESWISTPAWWRQVRRLRRSDMVILDGAEQLSGMEWLRFRYFTRRAGAVLISTHIAGRFPCLYRCQTHPQLLADLTAALGESISQERARRLFASTGGNIRECLRALYDICAAQ